jgi:molybdopterin-binding protein
MVRVGLDCGFPLTALVTSPSFLELGVEEGSNVTAVVKANAIHLIAKE